MVKFQYGMLLLGLIVGLLIGYTTLPYVGPATTTITVTEYRGTPVPTITVTTTATMTVTTPVASPAPYKPPEKIRAAWIYVGPVEDFGWTYMHDVGRRVVANLLKDWLETTYIESVSKEKTAAAVDQLVKLGYNVIFTTSFDHMDPTYDKAQENPNVMFFHCSGYRRAPNMGTYFADLYQVYYLNGLMAGALTKTGKIGYIAAITIPEVIRHINAFAIGAMETGRLLNKNVTVYVVEIGEWYNPDKARSAAQTLVDMGVDVLAFTEDSTATVEFAETMVKRGKEIYVFSHYSPMYEYGPNSVVSGQLVRWEVIYLDILTKIRAGIYTPSNLENVDYWYLLNTGAAELGAHVYPNGTIMYINPKFEGILKSIIVIDSITGESVTVYDLVMRRYHLMKEAPLLQPLQNTALTHIYESIVKVPIGTSHIEAQIVSAIFDPFTGPLTGYCIADYGSRFCSGKSVGTLVRVADGERLTHGDLWTMDWFIRGVVYQGKM
ncbi:MAG: BMP family ABC transporter substrate-binding protein [Ignisphaera sp.]|nr:BMP family ABC transporter substrate-binding protein [Ignisphaera sp.]MCX8167490.1 BMP family ABC transporter substrate-binding protein [Ignisphaera sp.]MDW8084646.1 BMP family ABC transporter substrate-binding protein [Ignisphaera sp.]